MFARVEKQARPGMASVTRLTLRTVRSQRWLWHHFHRPSLSHAY